MKSLLRNGALFISTCAGTGFFPIAPGTIGTGVALVFWWFLLPVQPLIALAIIAFSFFIGVWSAGIAEEVWGADPGRVNWDEWVGTLITVWFLPKTLFVLIAAFVLFRIFDILKPWPIYCLEKLPDGWGVMADDVMAGIYSNLILHFVFMWM
jgi:phosphatidylglycerophosphatase A